LAALKGLRYEPCSSISNFRKATGLEAEMERTWWEKVEGTTNQILDQLRKIIDEGNARRVVVKQHGRIVAEFPLTVGVVGAVIAPIAAAIGALTAVLSECTIEVEKSTPQP
jgi:hypothetical protein